MKRKGCSTEEIIEMVKAMDESLNQEIADHLRKLLKDRGVSTSSFGERAFLSDGYVRQVLSGKKNLSKETLFGLYLYLELSETEVDEFLSIYGLELSNFIEDIVFKKYGIIYTNKYLENISVNLQKQHCFCFCEISLFSGSTQIDYKNRRF